MSNWPKRMLFLHLDDEADRIYGIPRAMRRLCLDALDCEVLGHPMHANADKTEFTFTLKRDGQATEVQYRIFETTDALLAVAAADLTQAVFVIDLMLNDSGPQEGIRACRGLLERNVGRDKIFVLTGYGREARQALDGLISPDHIHIKPISIFQLIPVLTQAAGLPLPPLDGGDHD